MAREREYYHQEQNHFAKKHTTLLRGVYMSDIDGYQTVFTNGENKNYMEYTYTADSTPIVRRFVETKSRDSKYIRAVISGEVKPSQQFRAFVSVTAELNGFRRANDLPEVECWLVIQDMNEYPYEVFNVTMSQGGVSFDLVAKVWNDQDYSSLFQL